MVNFTPKGFTLVEIVLAFGLLALLMTAANLMLFSSLRSARKAQAAGVTNTEGSYAMNAMTDMIRYARQLTACSATGLSITRVNGDDVTYSLSGARIASNSANRNVGGPIYLTSPRVSVTIPASTCGSRLFTCTNNRVVAICFAGNVVGAADTTETAPVNFRSQVVLRNFGN